MRKQSIASLVFIAAVCFAGAAHAAAGFTVGLNIAGSHAAGYGRSSNFGMDAGYDFDSHYGVDLSYESLMGYEMTVLGASATGRYALSRRWHLLGRLGVAYWTESPTGAYSASGEDPLLGIGLSYAIDRALSLRGEYQVIPNATGKLGVNLDSVVLGLQYHFR